MFLEPGLCIFFKNYKVVHNRSFSFFFNVTLTNNNLHITIDKHILLVIASQNTNTIIIRDSAYKAEQPFSENKY